MEEDKYFSREKKRIILRLRILRRIQVGKAYSYEISKEFGSGHLAKFFGKNIKNDVYNTINALESSGYIKVSTKVEGGRIKKYYSLTKKGSGVMKSAKRIMNDMAKEVTKLFE